MLVESTRCAVSYATEELRERAALIAAKLCLPLLPGIGETDNFPFLLLVSATRLELHLADATLPSPSKPLYVDFSAGRSVYRHRHANVRGEAVARACGMHKNNAAHLKIIDATAGLARDAFVLAGLGSEVTLIERNSIVAALLADGLQRATHLPETAPVIKRMKLVSADSRAYLQALEPDHFPDVIYLDPMYPAAKKQKSLVKKEQQMLQALLGPDTEVVALLEIALQRVRKRVVLKRPRAAPVIALEAQKNVSIYGFDQRQYPLRYFFPAGELIHLAKVMLKSCTGNTH